VKHLKRPDWGLGRVLGQEGETVSIQFQNVGVKKLNTGFANLEIVDKLEELPDVRPGIHPRPGVDIQKLETLCKQFFEEMKDNRKSSNDGSMGLKVLREMGERGDLSDATRKQLLAWCHTEGSVYQRGVGLAQQICQEVYGRVPPRD
jgi:hypothetical protein